MTKPTPEALAKMGLEYGPNGHIQKIGTVPHPDVVKAEEAAVNKPKELSQIEGYRDEKYLGEAKTFSSLDELRNAEPITNIHHPDIKSPMEIFKEEFSGQTWAECNQRAVEELIGAPFVQKPLYGLSESNPDALFNNAKKGDFIWNDKDNPDKGISFVENQEGRFNVINQPTTHTQGFDIEGPDEGMFKAVSIAADSGVLNDKPEKSARKPAAKKNVVAAPPVEPEMFEEIPEGDKQRCFIGIDNGVSGSIGVIREDGTYSFYITPVKKELNYTKVKSFISRIKVLELTRILSVAGPGSMVMIERPMVNPSMFQATVSAIRAFEATVTILETLRLPYEVVDSKGWQKALLPSGVFGDQLKPASLNVGNRLFPEAAINKHKDRDGMLIAAYCKKTHK